MADGEEIRREVERLTKRGRGSRYPSELKERLLAYTVERRRAGITLEAIGAEVGVSWRTLSRWSSEARRTQRKFRRVEVVTPQAAIPRSLVVVHGPCGTRIEGLDLDGVADLLRKLG